MRLLQIIVVFLLLLNTSTVSAQDYDSISPRVGSRMAVDTQRNQVILFGGYTIDEGRTYHDDTWIFSPTDNTWTRLLVDGPSPRGAHSMVYSAEHDIILLFGGLSGSGRLGDTWVFDCSTESWSLIETDTAPEGRSDSDMVYDPVRGVFILYGGWGDRTGFQRDTWAFDPEANTWSEYVTAIEPGPMYGQRLQYESVNECVILYGGHLRSPISREYIEDVWYFYPANSSWIKSDTINKPHGRYWNAVAYSAEFSSLVSFGGTYGEGAIDETWILDTNDMSWNQLNPSQSPSRRVISDMVYVDSLKCFILFGGGGLIDGVNQQYNDTWKLDPSDWSWTQIQTSYTFRERNQTTEQGIPGFTTSTILIGVGWLILLNKFRS